MPARTLLEPALSNQDVALHLTCPVYVVTQHNQPRPKCLTKAIRPKTEERLRSLPHLALQTKSAASIEEVTDHLLLTIFSCPNPIHNGFDLWELTTLYQEVRGSAWLQQKRTTEAQRTQREETQRASLIARSMRSHQCPFCFSVRLLSVFSVPLWFISIEPVENHGAPDALMTPD